MILFEFEGLRADRPSLKRRHEILLGMVADFRIQVERRVLYQEVEFPVIEFAISLHAWLLQVGEGPVQDFEFDSMEAAEPGIVWIRRSEHDAWRIGSIHQEYPEMKLFPLKDLALAHDDFMNRLKAEGRQRLNLDLHPLFDLAGWIGKS